LPNEEDFTHGVINGFFNIQRLYNLSASQLVQGIALESENEKDEHISSEEALFIAEQAEKMRYLHFSVERLEVALLKAVDEEKQEDYMKNVRTNLPSAKERHDQYTLSEGFVNTMIELEKTRFQLKPFTQDHESTEEYIYHFDTLQKIRTLNGMFYDVTRKKEIRRISYFRRLKLDDKGLSSFVVTAGQE